ncbi:mannitol-1-phosphate 5-dehydrogenase [Planomicrobium sp. CPCC 101110]|uniref:mannitol-1-phosphate 5-dehydrogenase n=1 Tax=Planomicrobium sp. CPCC 101110 TaxID=2599619 RepID=UPI0011B54E43|nr:mannitol-1-phosphate 5-dehydrogenase [Planomicrobium sp. CPCC 101110]TWT25873.1 mannitol-1-phosphate 5-dehydrogenase [Planomicrobium sp. CPCC 101110]
MQAVHFGAGNIGRGFIGALLYQSGYQTLFLDVNDTVIQELNQQRAYEVTLVGTEQEIISVKNVSGINSSTHPAEAAEALGKADLITAAVGPNVLPHIARLLAEGLKVRMRTRKDPVNVIACENMINGSSILKKHVYEYLNEEEKQAAEQLIGFPNAAVDRIVPDQRPGNILGVAVEPYYEWVVEEAAIKGQKPDVAGITYVDDLNPYIERKLFTVNTGHTVPAYLGHYKNYSTINEAMGDKEIDTILQGALAETGEVVVRQHKFDREEHAEYIRKIIGRFRNPYVSDYVTRVARGPIRKLGQNDRLIRPASLYIQLTGKEPVHLAAVIAGVLLYENDQDDEARRLREQIAEKGYEKTLQSVSGLEAGDPLIAAVMKQLDNMKR